MKKMKSGLVKAISSTLIGLMLVSAISYFAKEGWIPSYSVTLLGVFNIITSILTLSKMRRWGVFYGLGWLTGAFIFNALGLLGTVDIVFNIAAPIVIILLRLFMAVKNSLQKAVAR
jgi:hypothetical protein